MRQVYHYAPAMHVWHGQRRYIGVAVHVPETGYFELRLLDRADLVRRLWDVPLDAVDRIFALADDVRDFAERFRGDAGLLERLGMRGGELRFGMVHTGKTAHVGWAVGVHFDDYAHPSLALIG